MKKKFIGILGLLVTIVAIAFNLSACREMSKDDVVDQLISDLETLESYLASGSLAINVDDQKYIYDITVAFDGEERIKISLKNEAGDEQLIVRKDGDVYILTPDLNKMFKLQSDWPWTGSHVYLYQSLLADILNADGETIVFESTETAYVFTIPTAYMHTNDELVEQIMHFDRKLLTPTLVEVRDNAGVARVTMEFAEFKLNHEFLDAEFDIDAIMELALDVMGDNEIEELTFGYPNNVFGMEVIADEIFNLEDGQRKIISLGDDTRVATLIQETRSSEPLMNIQIQNGGIVLVSGETFVYAYNDDVTIVQTLDGRKSAVSRDFTSRELAIMVASIEPFEEK